MFLRGLRPRVDYMSETCIGYCICSILIKLLDDFHLIFQLNSMESYSFYNNPNLVSFPPNSFNLIDTNPTLVD